jgi:plastocyanin
MPKLGKRSAPSEAKPDVLEVTHHEIPDTAAGAGALPIPGPAYGEGGLTWRRMLRAVAVTEVAGAAALLIAGTIYGLDFFTPLAITVVLFGVAAVWIPRMTKASTVFALVVSSLMLVMFGGLFFGWTGFFYLTSWFEVAFATLAVLVPIAGIVAAIATLRHRNGANAARTPMTVTAAVCAALVLVGIVGSVVSSNAARLPGDVTLAAKNFAFAQTSLTARSGDVAIYFENKDPFVHNVRIDGHGGSKNASGRQSVRHVFQNLAPGTYAYYCSLHKGEMKGTLTVT